MECLSLKTKTHWCRTCELKSAKVEFRGERIPFVWKVALLLLFKIIAEDHLRCSFQWNPVNFWDYRWLHFRKIRSSPLFRPLNSFFLDILTQETVLEFWGLKNTSMCSQESTWVLFYPQFACVWSTNGKMFPPRSPADISDQNCLFPVPQLMIFYTNGI